MKQQTISIDNNLFWNVNSNPSLKLFPNSFKLYFVFLLILGILMKHSIIPDSKKLKALITNMTDKLLKESNNPPIIGAISCPVPDNKEFIELACISSSRSTTVGITVAIAGEKNADIVDNKITDT